MAIELPILQGSPSRHTPRFSLRALLLRLYRLAVVVAIVWIIHTHHARLRIDADAPITVAEIQPILPSAVKLQTDPSDRLGLFALDAKGKQIGYALRTAPISDSITGYLGPTDTLIVMDYPDMRVVGVRIRSSKDTVQHVQDVANDEYFLKTWNGKNWDELAGMDPRAAGIEGVSGASLTSMCIANSIHYRFQHLSRLKAQQPQLRFTRGDIGIVVVLLIALVFTFTHLRSRTWLRRPFQLGLIVYLGFWNGRLIAQSLLSGWAESTIPWRLAPGLVLLVAAALIVPWTSRRAMYCSHVCPFGAMQEWTGRVFRSRFRFPHGIDAGLRWMPLLLIAFVLTITMLNVPFNLAAIEPFDAFLIKTAGAATIAIAVIGLLAAALVPMAYCKYGCPTGALLSFVRSHGKADVFGRRDIAAGALVILTIALYMRYDAVHQWLVR